MVEQEVTRYAGCLIVAWDIFNKVTTNETYRKPEHVESAKDR